MRRTLMLLVLAAIITFVPMVQVTYPVIESIPATEMYVTVEPYTVTEDVRVSYTSASTTAVWHDGGLGAWKRKVYLDPYESLRDFGKVQPGYYTMRQYPVTHYRIVQQEVVRYREATKTRTVVRPTVVYKQRRVSLLRWLLQ